MGNFRTARSSWRCIGSHPSKGRINGRVRFSAPEHDNQPDWDSFIFLGRDAEYFYRPVSIKLSQLHPDVRRNARWALDVAKRYKVPVTVTSAYRSKSHQRRLFERYKAGKSRWPAAPPGQSAHNYGFAFDSVVEPRYQKWWNYVREYAGFHVPKNDEIHAAVPNWRRYA